MLLHRQKRNEINPCLDSRGSPVPDCERNEWPSVTTGSPATVTTVNRETVHAVFDALLEADFGAILSGTPSERRDAEYQLEARTRYLGSGELKELIALAERYGLEISIDSNGDAVFRDALH